MSVPPTARQADAPLMIEQLLSNFDLWRTPATRPIFRVHDAMAGGALEMARSLAGIDAKELHRSIQSCAIAAQAALEPGDPPTHVLFSDPSMDAAAGATPLGLAALLDMPEHAAILLGFGARLGPDSSRGNAEWLRPGAQIRSSPEWLAMARGSARTLALLASAGGDLRMKAGSAENQITLLHRLAGLQPFEGKRECAAIMAADRKAYPDLMAPDGLGLSAAVHAERAGDPDFANYVRLLHAQRERRMLGSAGKAPSSTTSRRANAL
jgi:hypothetical protein